MNLFTVYTDGSFHTDGKTHGGVVFDNGDGTYNCVHVHTSNPNFVSMRNVGGEVLAAWSAIMAIVNRVKNANEEGLDSYELKLIYDYEGVGKWLTGAWKTNKTATRWFVQSVNKMLSEVPNLKVTFIWVKGHGVVTGNNMADRVSEYTMSYALRNNIPICDMDETLKEVR